MTLVVLLRLQKLAVTPEMLTWVKRLPHGYPYVTVLYVLPRAVFLFWFTSLPSGGGH